LRVPHGNASGAGFAGTGFQSLKRLANGDIETLASIDANPDLARLERAENRPVA
jgi:hypothetical protein